MEEQNILKEFTDAGAILHGHFILSSGLHSNTYMQCARVLMEASRGERLCKALAAKVRATLFGKKIDLVVAPAMGGVVVGYEMGRQLGVPAVFCERVDGKFVLRRGFDIQPGQKILIVEDVVTTGKSSLETRDCIHDYGGQVVGEACLVDRSHGEAKLDFPLVSLLKMTIPAYEENNLPPELKALPAVKPGSRFLKT